MNRRRLGLTAIATTAAATLVAIGGASPARAATTVQDPGTTVFNAALCSFLLVGPDAHGTVLDVVTCEVTNALAGR